MSIDPTTIIDIIEKCVKIYGYLEAVKKSVEERRRFMQEVSAFKVVLVNLQKRLEDPALPQNHSSTAALALLFDPEKAFVQLVQRDLTELEEKLCRRMDKKKTWYRELTKIAAAGIWPLDKAESDALFIRIERYKSLISLATQQDVDQLVLEILRMGEDSQGMLSEVIDAVADVARVIGVRIRDDERMKVAEWISKIDFGAYHAENSRKWLKGTGRWVLESSEFQNWVSRTSFPPVLWCYGDAGAGKSVAAAMIVDHLRADRNNVVLVIVCRYNQDQQYLRETHTFMCCLLRQLLQLEASSTIPPSLLDLHRKGIHPSEDCVRTLLIEVARMVGRPIFIVLDALDECPLGFALMAAIQRLGNGFSLLITSRNVFAEIKDYPSLRIRPADHDILALVDNKMPKLPYVQEDGALQATIRTEVVAKAKGMFLLASLTLQRLERDVTCKADVREVLASIPASLDEAYHQIFDRIHAQGDKKKELALQAIMWIYTQSKHPLETSRLRFLLACQISRELEFQEDRMPSKLDIINACRGLVQVNLAVLPYFEEEFSFIHYSVHEYVSRCLDSILPKDHYEFAFKICTIALRHIESSILKETCQHPLRRIWFHLAMLMDSNHPHLVLSVLEEPNFAKSATALFSEDLHWSNEATDMLWTGQRKQRIQDLLKRVDGTLNTLEYIAVFGFARTFRLARETKALDEHELHWTMEILVMHHHWNLVHEVWACGEYDINAYCEIIRTTAICELLSGRNICSGPKELRRSFLQHPHTSLNCPRHDRLLGCSIAGYSWNYGELTLEDIVTILERHYRDGSSPGRISVYLPPSRMRSRPPDILDVIAVFLQRADIDLDAHITLMVPPEILLALLMLPWYRYLKYVKEETLYVLRPYARRPADIPDASASNRVLDADALADNVVPDTAQAVEALDVCATPEPGSADNTPARLPDTAREVGAQDLYRMTVVHLVIGSIISLFIYLCYLQHSVGAHSYW